MFKFIAGIVVGIVLSTVGVSGIAKLLDNGVHAVQDKAAAAATRDSRAAQSDHADR